MRWIRYGLAAALVAAAPATANAKPFALVCKGEREVVHFRIDPDNNTVAETDGAPVAARNVLIGADIIRAVFPFGPGVDTVTLINRKTGEATAVRTDRNIPHTMTCDLDTAPAAPANRF